MSDDKTKKVIVTKVIKEPKWIRYANNIGNILCPIAGILLILTALCYLWNVGDPNVLYDLATSFGAIALFPFTLMGMWLSYKKATVEGEEREADDE